MFFKKISQIYHPRDLYSFQHVLRDNFTLVRVMSKPRMEVTIIIPTKMKEMC